MIWFGKFLSGTNLAIKVVKVCNYINPRGQLTRPSEIGTKILGFLYWNALVNI